MAEGLKQISGIDLLVSEKVKELTDLREAVKEEYGPLTGIATTPENLAERKKDKAAITKKKKAVNDERIAFEKKWKEAIAPITDEYKMVTGLLTVYEEDLKSTLDEFEQQRVEAKKKLIETVFDEAEKAPAVSGWLCLADIYNPKWENATYQEKDIKADIENEFSKLKISYDSICMMNHDYQEEGLKVLKDTRDFQQAVVKMNELAEQQKLIEARQKAEQEAEAERLRIAQEAQEKKRLEEEAKKLEAMSLRERAELAMEAAELANTPAEFKSIPDPTPAVLPFGNPTLVPVYTVKCTVRTTVELELIKHSLDNLGISYEVRKEMIDE